MADIEIEGLPPLIEGMRKSPEIFAEETTKAAQASLLLLVADLKEYPPPPENSTYVRTRTLGRTWSAARPQFSSSGINFEGRIGNPTPYAPDVQGASEQKPVHRGRWMTDEQAIEAEYDAIKEQFEAAATRVAQRIEAGG